MIAHSEWKATAFLKAVGERTYHYFDAGGGARIRAGTDGSGADGTVRLHQRGRGLDSKKKRQRLTGLRVRPRSQAETPPQRIYPHQAHLYGERKLGRKAVEDAVALSKKKYCPVSRMLEQAARSSTKLFTTTASRSDETTAGSELLPGGVAGDAAGAVALLAAITTMHFAIHGAEVQVPALKGMTVADARSQTAGLGLKLDVDNRYYSGRCGRGAHSDPVARAGNGGAAGVEDERRREPGPAKSGSARDGGPGRTHGGVELRRVGLGVGVTARLPWPGAAEGTVLAQDPPGSPRGLTARTSICW